MNSPTQNLPKDLGVCRAHDVGYGWVKSIFGHDKQGQPIKHAFPSVVCQETDRESEDVEQAKRDIRRVKINDKEFVVGKDVRFFQKYGSDRIQHNEYVKTDEYLALLRGAFAYDTVDHIDLLVLGLPQKYMKSHKDYLINKAKGSHTLDDDRTVFVDKVMIVSQPLAAAYNHSRRAHREGASTTNLSAITLTLESGWFTKDWTVSEGLKTYDHQCGSVEGGAAVILSEMMKEASKYTEGGRQLEDMLKFDENWRSGHLRFEKDDLTSVRKKIDVVRLREAKKYFSQMKNGTLNFKGVERVVATGGSIHLYQDIIEKEFAGLDISVATPEQRRWDVVEGMYGLGEFVLKRNA